MKTLKQTRAVLDIKSKAVVGNLLMLNDIILKEFEIEF